MPYNLLKRYSDLLELAHMNEEQRTISLKNIFNRDWVQDALITFNNKPVRPTKNIEGQPAMDVLFDHLTRCDEYNETGEKTGRRVFELERSLRLHWVRFHVDLRKPENVLVFSYVDRIKREDVIRTYIYDVDKKYVVILEPHRSKLDYYLITAYYLNKKEGTKQIN
ncbi:MAG TPA: hypothetical protein PLC65_14615, partial [Bacteroidia bacterium]|nr:hypothetical protein [Bacteroidia bacterium]